jgi:peptidoglycan/xylan/chitin deacetylase (PgdA/CDA1 family)
MKLYVIRARRMAVYLAALSAALLVLFAVNMGKNDALAVFSARKEIPIYSVDVPEKVASITFDCAWGADDIPDILNTLKEADAKATFFLVGQWAEKNPETVRLIAQDGHDIANHSYSHFRMGSSWQGKDKQRNLEMRRTAGKVDRDKVRLVQGAVRGLQQHGPGRSAKAGVFYNPVGR